MISLTYLHFAQKFTELESTIKVSVLHGREVCRARGGGTCPPPQFCFEDRQNISPCPPPQILVMIIKLIIGSNNGGSIKNYQHCTVYSLYCIVYCINDTAVYLHHVHCTVHVSYMNSRTSVQITTYLRLSKLTVHTTIRVYCTRIVHKHNHKAAKRRKKGNAN